jgi:hypothetical protein
MEGRKPGKEVESNDVFTNIEVAPISDPGFPVVYPVTAP